MLRFFSIAVTLLVVSCKQPESHSGGNNVDSLISLMRKDISDHLIKIDGAAALRYLNEKSFTIHQIDNPELTSVWNAYKGSAFLFESEKDSAKYFLDQAFYLADKYRLKKARLIAQIQMVSYWFQEQKYDSALTLALHSLELSRSAETTDELPVLYRQLASLYRMAGDSASTKKYLFEGLKISRDSFHVAGFSSDIGRYFIQHNEIDSAIHFFQNFQHFNKYAGPYIAARKLEDLALLTLQQGMLNESKELFIEAITLYKQARIPYAAPYMNLAASFIDLGKPLNAKPYLDTALILYRKQGNFENVSDALFQKSRLLLHQGRNEAAYAALDSSYIYHLQNDSVSFRDQAKEIQSRLSDQKLASLSASFRASQKINRQRNMIIGALVLICLLITFIAILIIRRRKLKHLLDEAALQQQLLRSQMEPHFVFNSLGTLQGYHRNGNNKKAAEFLDKFSRVLRLSLENARQSFVPVQDEVKALEAYLSLQRSQTENAFDYYIETYPGFEADKIFIPPMLLQPFVENAIVHGFANLKERGWVAVKIIRNNETLRCTIEDNGTGLNSAPTNGSKRSLSTVITKERLALLGKLTGNKADIVVINKNNLKNERGALVTIDIPFCKTFRQSS